MLFCIWCHRDPRLEKKKQIYNHCLYRVKGSDESITGKRWRWNTRNLQWQLQFPEAMVRISLWRRSYNLEIKWYAICGFIPMWFPIRSQTLLVRCSRSYPIINTLKPKALPQHPPENSQTSWVDLTIIDAYTVIIIRMMLQGGNPPSMNFYLGCHPLNYTSLGHVHIPLSWHQATAFIGVQIFFSKTVGVLEIEIVSHPPVCNLSKARYAHMGKTCRHMGPPGVGGGHYPKKIYNPMICKVSNWQIYVWVVIMVSKIWS